MEPKTLRELRISKGISPSFVANKLNVSHRHFSRIENGEGYLTKERIKILARLYNTTTLKIKQLGGIKC